MAAFTSGSCLCGKVKYECAEDSRTKILCHCRNCQKWSGGDVMPIDFFLRKAFKITSGEDLIKKYTDTVTDSTYPVDRHFCSNCGSPVYAFMANPKGKEVVAIANGTRDDVKVWQPQVEVFCRNAAEYAPKYENVMKFDGLIEAPKKSE